MLLKISFILILLLLTLTIAQESSTGTAPTTIAPAIPCGPIPYTEAAQEMWYFIGNGCPDLGDGFKDEESCWATCRNFFGSVTGFTISCNYYGEWVNAIDGAVLTEDNAHLYCDPVETETSSSSTSSTSSTSSVSSSYSTSYYYVAPIESVVVEIPLAAPLESEEDVKTVKDSIIYGIVDKMNADEEASGKLAMKRDQISASHYTYDSVSNMVIIDAAVGRDDIVIVFIDVDDLDEDQAEANGIDLDTSSFEDIEIAEVYVALVEFWEDPEENTLIEAGFFEENAAIVAEPRTQCWDGSFESPCPEEPNLTSIIMDAASELVWIIAGVIMACICIFVIIHAYHSHQKHEKGKKFDNQLLTAPILQQPVAAGGAIGTQQFVAAPQVGQPAMQYVQAQPQQVIMQQPVQVVQQVDAQGNIIQQVVNQQQVQVVQQVDAQGHVVGQTQIVQQVVQQPVQVAAGTQPIALQPAFIEGGHEAVPIEDDQIHITIG